MRFAIAAPVLLALTIVPAAAQVAQPVVGPMQALGNIIRNPNAQPAPPQPGRAPGLPTAVPPNTIGINPGR
jgi:hypothetical protein